MSTKTLRKRIALIAVSAMGFGLLSATPSSAYLNATPGDLSYASATSVGVLAQSINTKLLGGTATLLSTGTLSLDVDSATAAYTKVVVSAGGYIASGSAGETISADQLSATGGFATAGRVDVKTTLTSGTFTVTGYASNASGAAPVALVTVTVATSSVAGTVSTSKSTVTWAATSTLGLGTGGVDSATGNATTTGNPLYLNIQLKDAYGAAITSSSGALVVTASSGANVGINAAGTFATTVSGSDPSNTNVYVKESTSGAGWSGTVTVTYNGVTVATKSGSITGNVASLVIANNKIGKTGASNAKALTYTAKDAAGNALATTATDVKFSSSSNTAVVSTLVGDNNSTTTDAGYAAITCGVAGTANVVAKYTVASTGVVISSNSLAVLCGDTAKTFTAALDKAKYAQGDVATLTLTFKDSKGNLANSYDSVTSLNGTKESISFPMAKQIGSITGAEVTDKAGTVAFKFNVGDVSSFSAGKYNAVVTYPTPADATAQTVAFEVSGSGGVSNSDILASIVKLITAINKQIAALQKLLLKK
jgi:hypothetical protein